MTPATYTAVGNDGTQLTREVRSIADVRRFNQDAGNNFFEHSTMRFFQSRVCGELHGRYFVTSERGPTGPRCYTVRRFEENGSVSTVGEFQEYPNARQARLAAERLARKEG